MTIFVSPHPEISNDKYHAVIMKYGETAGDAIGVAVNAWEAQGGELTGSRIFFKKWGDEFFSGAKIDRVQGLIAKRNHLRETDGDLSEADCPELDALIGEELTAQGGRLDKWIAEADKI